MAINSFPIETATVDIASIEENVDLAEQYRDEAEGARDEIVDTLDSLSGLFNQTFSGRVALFGDSQSARAFWDNTSSNPSYRNSASYMNWACAYSGGTIHLDYSDVYAQGGSTTANLAQQVNSFLSRTTDKDYSFAVISIGTNDAAAVSDVEDIKGRIISAATDLSNAGLSVVFIAPFPRTYTGSTPDFEERLAEITRFLIYTLKDKVPSARVVSGWQTLMDSATGKSKGGTSPTSSDYFVDTTHLSPKGAQIVGYKLYQTLSAGLPDVDTGPANLTLYSEENPIGPLFPPSFYASDPYSGGDSNITGSVPTGWEFNRQGTQTCTSSIIEKVKGLGTISSWQVDLARIGAAGGTFNILRDVVIPDSVGGKRVKLAVRLTVEDAVDLTLCEARLQYNKGDTASTVYSFFRSSSGNTTFQMPDGTYSLFIETDPILIEEDVTNQFLRSGIDLDLAVGGSVKIIVESAELTPV